MAAVRELLGKNNPRSAPAECPENPQRPRETTSNAETQLASNALGGERISNEIGENGNDDEERRIGVERTIQNSNNQDDGKLEFSIIERRL